MGYTPVQIKKFLIPFDPLTQIKKQKSYIPEVSAASPPGRDSVVCGRAAERLSVERHIAVAWGLYSISVVTLALNRCIEIHSIDLADRLFGGRKAYLWMIPPWIYSLIMFSSTIDMPPIYNTVWSVYMFRIDFRDGAPPVIDWVCFLNCVFVIFILLVLYALLIYRLKKKSGIYKLDTKKASKLQKHAMLQSFLICFFLFLASSLYAVAGFIQLPNHMLKFATISVQICSGSTSIVYLVINQEIRKGVTRMILGDNSVVSSVANSTMAISTKSSPDLKRYA
uniref:7TM GPCR serpentine receptor class x (Srx) domain-containing protein n=1 Tax=Ditylenchus dipsaci TaxID=166011 RepID=A0A915E2Y3_9BILA